MDLTPYKNCLAHTHGVYISNELKPYKPCCWFRTGIEAVDLDDYRTQLSKLDIEHNCSHCIKQERDGATWSHRMLFKDPEEFVLGVCFDNICNLKCVTCSPTHTSQLISEWTKLESFNGKFDKKYYTTIMKQAPSKFDFVKSALTNTKFKKLRLEIFGGEPLINPTVFEFMDWLAEQPYASQTLLGITTNGTVYTDKIKEYTKKFKHVGLQLSIDGTGESFEYLRTNAVWTDTVDVANKYYAMFVPNSNFSFNINYTLSWMNSANFANFYKWVDQNFPNAHLHLTRVETPTWYSVDVLSNDQRKRIATMMLDQIAEKHTNPQFEKLKELYKQSMLFEGNQELNQRLYTKAKDLLSTLDNMRDRNFQQTFANITELIK
jgi:sulfatase maturation enzyme AslB (radical SAM superfamily)